MTGCPVPGCDSDEANVSVYVNNSEHESEKGIDETEVTFDANVSGYGSSVYICNDCWDNSRHLH